MEDKVFERSRLKIIRRGSMVSAVMPIHVFLNGVLICDLKNGEAFEVDLTREHNQLIVNFVDGGMHGKNNIEFDAKPGAVGEVHFRVDSFLMSEPKWESASAEGENRLDTSAPAKTKTLKNTSVWLVFASIALYISLPLLISFFYSFVIPTSVAAKVLLGVFGFGLGLTGALLLRQWIKRVKGQPENKPGMAPRIVLSILGAFTLFTCFAFIFGNTKMLNLNNALRGSVTEKNGYEAQLPEDPKFVFYDEDDDWYSYPNKDDYPNAADSPDQVNVIVCLDRAITGAGKWVTSSGAFVGNAEAEQVFLDFYVVGEGYVHEDNSFDKTIGYNKSSTGTRPQDWDEVIEYINDTLSGAKSETEEY